MLRFLFTVTLVAALCRCIAGIDEQTAGSVYGSTQAGADWVRTVDGWERSTVLSTPAPSRPGGLHPVLVATLQAGVSVMALLGFSHRTFARPHRQGLPAGSSVGNENAYRPL